MLKAAFPRVVGSVGGERVVPGHVRGVVVASVSVCAVEYGGLEILIGGEGGFVCGLGGEDGGDYRLCLS